MKKLLFSLFLVLQVFNTWAQSNQEIKGRIVDSKSQQPIKAVVANITGTNQTERTNDDGNFIFNNAPAGSQTLVLTYPGYLSKRLPLELTIGQHVDLGVIVLEEDITADIQLNLITLTDNDLGDDNSGSETTSGLLQASRDAFQQAAAFNWGQARFKIRGLDNEFGKTMINGIVMNKVYDGRPQWSNWGGLNDVTRNQEFSMGSAPSDYTFGGILGTQAINTRASYMRKGTRLTFSGGNTNYTWRPVVTHSSGMNAKGWAYTFSASYRGADEAYFDGTNYDAKSLFVAIEKRFNDSHSLNFTGIYAQNKRAKNAPLTDEAADLKGFKYNSYWGWQGDDKRNSRYKEVEEPIFMLTHYWTINENNRLTTSASYQFGKIGNSRLGYNGANNPDPTYYRNMPSYFSGYHDKDGNFLGNQEPYLTNAATAKQYFLNNSQINWDEIYRDNMVNGTSRVIQYEDRTDDKALSFNSNLNSTITDHLTLNAGVNYRRLHSENFSIITDLLGGSGYKDVDNFFTGDKSQPNINQKNRIVGEGDRFGYNYDLQANVIDVFTQFKFNYERVNFYLAQNISYTDYQRDGLYKNGIYPTNSYGKSDKVNYNNFGFKGGATVHLSGRHILNANVAYMNQAPSLRNVFSNARLNNNITPDLKSEDIFSIDGSYILRTPKLKARATAYLSEIKNSSDLSFYYAEGIGVLNDQGNLIDDKGDAFVSEILTGINKRNLGVELGAEYQIIPTVKATATVALGQSFYTNNPNIKLNIDNVGRTVDYGTAYLKNYRVASGPQTAASLGLEYRDPKFWWIGANANYLDNNYIDISPILRTDNFVTNPQDPNRGPFADMTKDDIRDILKQEKLQSLMLVNLTGGKSWRINRNTLGFFASINNIFDVTYKTGGFEQARNANYKELSEDKAAGTPSFGNKYFYGYGRNFFVNVYYNF